MKRIVAIACVTGCFYGRTPETKRRAYERDGVALVLGVALTAIDIAAIRQIDDGGLGLLGPGLAVGVVTAVVAAGGIWLNAITSCDR